MGWSAAMARQEHAEPKQGGPEAVAAARRASGARRSPPKPRGRAGAGAGRAPAEAGGGGGGGSASGRVGGGACAGLVSRVFGEGGGRVLVATRAASAFPAAVGPPAAPRSNPPRTAATTSATPPSHG